MIEAVVLRRTDGIKLINLHKMQAAQIRLFLNVKAVFFSDFFAFRCIP
jgi:hypothetical protein